MNGVFAARPPSRRRYAAARPASRGYTPAKGYRGTDVFTLKAVDASGLNSNHGRVTVDM